jgi:hypothetical protein
MMMARYQNRNTDEKQRGDQTTAPPAILPHQLLLKPIKAAADVVFFPAAAWGSRFFRHKSSCASLVLLAG